MSSIINTGFSRQKVMAKWVQYVEVLSQGIGRPECSAIGTPQTLGKLPVDLRLGYLAPDKPAREIKLVFRCERAARVIGHGLAEL